MDISVACRAVPFFTVYTYSWPSSGRYYDGCGIDAVREMGVEVSFAIALAEYAVPTDAVHSQEGWDRESGRSAISTLSTRNMRHEGGEYRPVPSRTLPLRLSSNCGYERKG